MWHTKIPRGVKNGYKNGMTILFDVEQFNSAYYNAKSSGLLLAIHDHRDKPIIESGLVQIHPGTFTQIALTPKVTFTSKDAINGFSPEDRNCYNTDETKLTYLTYAAGYHYSLENCFFDNAIRDIIWECRCIPSFHFRCIGCEDIYPNDQLGNCAGIGLNCARFILDSMGGKTGEIIVCTIESYKNETGSFRFLTIVYIKIH